MEQIKIIREALKYAQTEIQYYATFIKLENALTALAQLETGMQSVSERSIDIPIEQPTVNEDLIKEMIMETEYTHVATMPIPLYEKIKRRLSQVKPSIWKKYPDEKPQRMTPCIIIFDLTQTSNTSIALWNDITHKFYFGKYPVTNPEEILFWCYEQDLIKTIGVEE